MRNKLWPVLAVIIGLSTPFAAPAFAEPAGDASAGRAAATKTPPAHDENEVVCKREDVTGSRLGGRKVCHTRLEWEQMTEDARRALDNRQSDSLSCQPGSMGC